MTFISLILLIVVLVIVGAFVSKFAPVEPQQKAMISWVVYAIVFILLICLLLAFFGVDTPVVRGRVA